MRILGTERSDQWSWAKHVFQKVENVKNVRKQAEPKSTSVVNPKNYNFIQF